MKILIINGSPKLNGNTASCANYLKDCFEKNNIEVEIYHLGNKNIHHCNACGACYRNKNNRCIIDDDLNELITKVRMADGYVFGSPIHYSDISGLMKNALDRLFYVAGANGNYFAHKVGSSYVCVRRSGGSNGFHTLNNYLLYSEMFIATGSYWNIIHGTIKQEALKDAEGINTLSAMANNMAYLMKVIDNSTIEKPELQPKIVTNFIREDL
ncbi:MAG: flavodoxin family protein [Bacilli bacterium]|jgi:multimeric flavodoxin WrbA|nr:flavodoxin family protein [Bacilli bacterium]